MLESAFADESEQLLQLRNLYDSSSAKSLQRIAGKFAFAHISANFSGEVICRKPREAHWARFHASHARSKSIFFANRPGNNFLKIHLHILEKVLGQIAAVKTDRFIRIVRIVVIPVEQRAR